MFRFSCDGMCRLIGCERRGFIGVVGYHNDERYIELADDVGKATVNEAKYLSVIAALTVGKRFGAGRIEIQLDSNLIVSQLKGERITVVKLRELADRVHKLSGDFESVSFTVESDLRAKLLAWRGRSGERWFEPAHALSSASRNSGRR